MDLRDNERFDIIRMFMAFLQFPNEDLKSLQNEEYNVMYIFKQLKQISWHTNMRESRNHILNSLRYNILLALNVV